MWFQGELRAADPDPDPDPGADPARPQMRGTQHNSDCDDFREAEEGTLGHVSL